MFGGYIRNSVVVGLDYDPAADDYIPLWRAPLACEVVGAYATVANDVNAHTANYFSLELVNGGTAGTATTAMAGTIGGSAGWSALTPVPFTVTSGKLAAGELVTLKYDEEGTGTFAVMAVQLDYVFGEG